MSATELELLGSDGRVVCERCSLATRPLRRLRGLLGRGHLPPGEGILLRPAGAIHTFFMRFAIDVIFLDRELTVVAIAPGLSPWRTAAHRGADAVLELRSGESERRGLVVGERLQAAGQDAAARR
jgi:uncharacterized membrane protein (UPF0127 family)